LNEEKLNCFHVNQQNNREIQTKQKSEAINFSIEDTFSSEKQKVQTNLTTSNQSNNEKLKETNFSPKFNVENSNKSQNNTTNSVVIKENTSSSNNVKENISPQNSSPSQQMRVYNKKNSTLSQDKHSEFTFNKDNMGDLGSDNSSLVIIYKYIYLYIFF
jgi:hypothetical protein